jgi:ArsR family transcriptional regulator
MDETLQVFQQVANYFGLLADPTRLRILSCLCAEERAVHEVVEKVGLTQANISRHLNILYRAVSITIASRDLGDELGVLAK